MLRHIHPVCSPKLISLSRVAAVAIDGQGKTVFLDVSVAATTPTATAIVVGQPTCPARKARTRTHSLPCPMTEQGPEPLIKRTPVTFLSSSTILPWNHAAQCDMSTANSPRRIPCARIVAAVNALSAMTTCTHVNAETTTRTMVSRLRHRQHGFPTCPAAECASDIDNMGS